MVQVRESGGRVSVQHDRDRGVAWDGPLAVLNLGGVANVTFIDGDMLIAFDTGPGNALLDAANPTVSFISVGKDNTYGHPSPSALT